MADDVGDAGAAADAFTADDAPADMGAILAKYLEAAEGPVGAVFHEAATEDDDGGGITTGLVEDVIDLIPDTDGNGRKGCLAVLLSPPGAAPSPSFVMVTGIDDDDDDDTPAVIDVATTIIGGFDAVDCTATGASLVREDPSPSPPSLSHGDTDDATEGISSAAGFTEDDDDGGGMVVADIDAAGGGYPSCRSSMRKLCTVLAM